MCVVCVSNNGWMLSFKVDIDTVLALLLLSKSGAAVRVVGVSLDHARSLRECSACRFHFPARHHHLHSRTRQLEFIIFIELKKQKTKK